MKRNKLIALGLSFTLGSSYMTSTVKKNVNAMGNDNPNLLDNKNEENSKK